MIMDQPSNISQFALFDGVDSDILASVTSKLVSIQLSKGEYLYRVGDIPKGIYLIESGKICFTMPELEGKDNFIGIGSDGHYIGEVESIGKFKNFADAIALVDTTLWILYKEDFNSLFENVPKISCNLAKNLAFNMRLYHMAKSEQQNKSHLFRLANILLGLVSRFGERCEAGERIAMHLPHEDLAFMLGSTRQTVTNALNRWRKVGLLDNKYGKIVIRDKELFESYRDQCG